MFLFVFVFETSSDKVHGRNQPKSAKMWTETINVVSSMGKNQPKCGAQRHTLQWHSSWTIPRNPCIPTGGVQQTASTPMERRVADRRAARVWAASVPSTLAWHRPGQAPENRQLRNLQRWDIILKWRGSQTSPRLPYGCGITITVTVSACATICVDIPPFQARICVFTSCAIKEPP